ncbi:pyrimidine 5'-nucleotidase [Basidiobolus meristosporus CBS 931.73]|uniref:Pyrimidine 5'-nucleotidase n=1 Tax=Basidiobolus meristosporus CBS 931.73 TaxID=1314790 RepID=A0A1Y1YZP4_9FUNG|nr:pyrimidine 5'-nucleotidase [Basidiobolus meristosporus CBS 931.73]|eukprot:ORY03523.1 pyrimidine 5'-nucleotidase [Basidiobolus meristosporus CBS 931.73]
MVNTATSKLTEAQPVFFFDVDNCLYPQSSGIANMMKERIYEYGMAVGISQDEVEHLCERYYLDYGLAVRGLIKHHEIDPVEYDKKVDGGLPLEDILEPNLELRQMLQSLDMKKWVFTNAGLPHAQRVLRILGIEDQFDGITYCDYCEPDFPSKPDAPMYHRAMMQAGATDPKLCYLVDDSAANVNTAQELGWTAIHVTDHPELSQTGHHQIHKVTDLPKVLPHLWNRNK